MNIHAHCWSCGYLFEVASQVTKGDEQPTHIPTVGSVSVCIACGVVGVFDAHPVFPILVIRSPTKGELVMAMKDPRVMLTVRAIRERGMV